jgi:hypothetical protein
MMEMYLQKVKRRKNFFLNYFFVGVLKGNDERKQQGPDPNPDLLSQKHEPADPDPDPHQNVMDPQH